jgi:NAD+ dependent glucose-6-phosphate dehydrogenase
LGNEIIKVGITGADGTIGRTLHKGLRSRFELSLFDLHEIKPTAGVTTVRVDCGERDQLRGIFAGLDALIHLAGDPRPNAPRSVTLRNNFAATSYVFEEARQAGVRKVVFASSNFYHEGDIAAALRQASPRLIPLDRNPTPHCLYGESKVFGENAGRHLSHLGVQFVALRIGWTVPEDNPARYDSPYMRAMFCSHRDLVQAFSRALAVDTDFLTAFAVSNNRHGVFDLAETRQRLGFDPVDSAEQYV